MGFVTRSKSARQAEEEGHQVRRIGYRATSGRLQDVPEDERCPECPPCQKS